MAEGIGITETEVCSAPVVDTEQTEAQSSTEKELETLVHSDLKHVGRAELLEILLDYAKENDALVKRNSELEKQLSDKTLKMSKFGSIAEAAIGLNGVFEAAEASCAQYLENAKAISDQQIARGQEIETKARVEADRLLFEAREKCAKLELETQKKCKEKLGNIDSVIEEKWSVIEERLTIFYEGHKGLMELVGQGLNLVPERGIANAPQANKTPQQ